MHDRRKNKKHDLVHYADISLNSIAFTEEQEKCFNNVPNPASCLHSYHRIGVPKEIFKYKYVIVQIQYLGIFRVHSKDI